MSEIDVKPFEQETEKAVVRINSQAFAARCREPAEVYKYREISAQDFAGLRQGFSGEPVAGMHK